MESSINCVFAKYTRLSFERVKIINGIFRLLRLLSRVPQLVPLLFYVFFFSSRLDISYVVCMVCNAIVCNRSVSSRSFGLFWHTK